MTIIRPLATLWISLSALFTMAQADAGPDQEVCGTDATLMGNPLVPGQTGTWSIAPICGLITNANSPITDVTGLCFGENVIEWSITNGVSTTMDNVSIWAYDPFAPVAQAGVDQTILSTQNTTFMSGSQAVWPQVCHWTIVAGAGTFSNPTDPNTAVTGLSVGANTFRWTCDNGPCGTTLDHVVIFKSLPTGVSELDNGSNALFRFDPLTKQLSMMNGAQVTGMDLMDISGRRIPANAGSGTTWDLSHLPAGHYVVRAMVNGERQVTRLVLP